MTNHIFYSSLKGFQFYIFHTLSPFHLFDRGPNVISSFASIGTNTGDWERENQICDAGREYRSYNGSGNGDVYGDFFGGGGSQFMTDFVFEEANA